MDLKEMRLKTPGDLKKDVDLLKKEHMNLRFLKANSEEYSPSRMRDIKRQVARIMTVLTEKKREGRGSDAKA